MVHEWASEVSVGRSVGIGECRNWGVGIGQIEIEPYYPELQLGEIYT